jgi:predicted ATPase/class 3 adenylate cyclase
VHRQVPPVAVGCDHVVVPTGSGGWYPRSFLLTDIVGSVALWERDATGMSGAVARHEEIVAGAVAAAGGELVRSKGEGDSTFSVFSHPVEAVEAAAAVQQAIAAEAWPAGLGLLARAGVHTGDAELRRGDWYGPAVNRAARLRALAAGGQTLVSGVTAGLAADQLPAGVRLLYRGRRVLRGIERPEEVWELVRPGDPRLAASGTARAGSLPVPVNSFVGHREDVERLVELVERERLVTLTGPGGSGKTRMAMQAATEVARHGEAVWLAELAPVRDDDLVAQAVAKAVDVESRPDPLEGLWGQGERLAGVLVLDNCEHVLDACTALTRRLLVAAPGLRVLATSREPMGLAEERVWPVRPLAVPDESVRAPAELARVESVRLLLDRARALNPDLGLDADDVTPVVRICTALDGIPLAIELAAGRLRSVSFAELAARLDNQFSVLVRSRPATPDEERHRTLRTTFDWSYDLLTDQQQTLARWLSVFTGGFRLDLVESLCRGHSLDVLDAVDELVAKSLVTFDPATARYRLLEPLRQYLAQRLDEVDETESVQRAHARAVAHLCDRVGIRLLDDQKRKSRRLREEAGNIEGALQWALDHDQALAIRIIGALGQYWYFYDQISGRRWCGPVVDDTADVAPPTRARALLATGMVAQNDGEWDRSATRLREALAIYRTEDVTVGEAASLFLLGVTLATPWNPEHIAHQAEATSCFEESLRLYARLGDPVGAGWSRLMLSGQLFPEDLDRAEHLALQVIQECTAAGGRHPVPRALSMLAFIAHRRGDDQAALDYLQDALAIARELDDPGTLARALANLSAQQTTLGRGAEALASLAESARLSEQVGWGAGRSWPLAAAAVLYLARGQPTIATRALGAHDAHTPPKASTLGTMGDDVSILDEAISATRARLDAADVATAATAARRESVDQLIHELIIHVANTSV